MLLLQITYMYMYMYIYLIPESSLITSELWVFQRKSVPAFEGTQK